MVSRGRSSQPVSYEPFAAQDFRLPAFGAGVGGHRGMELEKTIAYHEDTAV